MTILELIRSKLPTFARHHATRHILAFLLAVLAHIAHPDLALFALVWIAAEVVLAIFIFLMDHETDLRQLLQEYRRHKTFLSEISDTNKTVGTMVRTSLPIRVLGNDESVWIFRKYFDKKSREFRRNLKNFEDGAIEESMPKISEMSEDIPDELKESAFCTFVETNLDFFLSEPGSKLLKDYQDCARRIARECNGVFTRVYIVEDMQRIDWKYYCVMRDDAQNAIDVRVVTRTKALEKVFVYHRRFQGMDFGLWDNSFVVIIQEPNARGSGGSEGPSEDRTMIVSKQEGDLLSARKIRDELLSGTGGALSWKEFNARYSAPINDWEVTSGHRVLRLPDSNGPSPTDCNTMIEHAVKSGLDANTRLAIFGLTHGILDAVVRGHAGKEIPASDIVCVDARDLDTRGAALYRPIRFIKKRWLDWSPDTNHRPKIVLGDDVLANFGLWQIPLFFEHMALHVLSPDGMIIFRTSARYSSAKHPSFETTVDFLRDLEQSTDSSGTPFDLGLLTESAIYELAWPVLHNSPPYKDETCSFDFSTWNEWVENDPDCSDELKRRMRQQPTVKGLTMTSPPFEEIERMAKPYFRATTKDASSVWTSSPALSGLPNSAQKASVFGRYYMITVFERVG